MEAGEPTQRVIDRAVSRRLFGSDMEVSIPRLRADYKAALGYTLYMQYVGSYLVRGGQQHFKALLEHLAEEGVIRTGSPDVYAREYRKFGVEESHDITGRARLRPVELRSRVFVLSIPGITVEAQNALLKTLEEPAADALFFIVTPSPEMLLPTVRSRTQTLDVTVSKPSSGLAVDPKEFLAATPQKRLDMLKPLYEHEDEGRDIGSVIGFLHGVEKLLAAQKDTRERVAGLRALYRARNFAGDKGSLLKSLLEQMALLCPTV